MLLSSEIIDYWPDIFDNIKVNCVPLKYTDTMVINFTDGKSWEIKIHDYPDDKSEEIESHLCELLFNYKDVIHELDFKINVNKLKFDIINQTTKLLH